MTRSGYSIFGPEPQASVEDAEAFYLHPENGPAKGELSLTPRGLSFKPKNDDVDPVLMTLGQVISVDSGSNFLMTPALVRELPAFGPAIIVAWPLVALRFLLELPTELIRAVRGIKGQADTVLLITHKTKSEGQARAAFAVKNYDQWVRALRESQIEGNLAAGAPFEVSHSSETMSVREEDFFDPSLQHGHDYKVVETVCIAQGSLFKSKPGEGFTRICTISDVDAVHGRSQGGFIACDLELARDQDPASCLVSAGLYYSLSRQVMSAKLKPKERSIASLLVRKEEGRGLDVLYLTSERVLTASNPAFALSVGGLEIRGAEGRLELKANRPEASVTYRTEEDPAKFLEAAGTAANS